MDKIASISEVGPQGTWGPMRVPSPTGELGRQSDADFARGEISGEINAQEEQQKAEAVAREAEEAEAREKAREEQKKAEAVGKWKHAHEQQQSPFGNLFPTSSTG